MTRNLRHETASKAKNLNVHQACVWDLALDGMSIFMFSFLFNRHDDSGRYISQPHFTDDRN